MVKSYKDLTDEDCKALLKKYDTPQHIFLHCRKVNAVAKFLATRLKEAGHDINIDLVDKASLLHDIRKYDEISKKIVKHVIEGEKTLLVEGYPEIAVLIGKHGLRSILEEKSLMTWNEIIVYYADKVVTNDVISSLQSRLDYLKSRYGVISPAVMQTIIISGDAIFALEKKIYDAIHLTPTDLTESAVIPYLIDKVY